MPRPQADRLFARFQRHGDQDCLGAVYDELAPQLTLVALHLGGGADAVEDLVQGTFVEAIEQAHKWDPERPLMPWLIGILATRTKRERRRLARRINPERVSHRRVSNPVESAQDAELYEQLGEALQRLPEPYRDVLKLHWIHGLSADEIGSVLAMPLETVRTKVKRGRERLRRLLPEGLVATMALGGAASTAQPARRRAFLRHARRRAGGDQTRQVVASRGARGLAAAAAVLGAIATGVWWTSIQRAERPRPAATRLVQGTRTEAWPAVGARGDVSRSLTMAPALGPRGLAVRWSDGSPAVGAAVGLRRERDPEPLLGEVWRTADAAGRVDLKGLSDGRYSVYSDRGGAARLTITDGRATRTSLTIPAGVDLLGHVTADGAPLAGASVWVSDAARPDEGRVVATTGNDGAFIARSVEPGRAYSVWADGFSPTGIQWVRDEPGGTLRVDVDLSPRRSAWQLSGTVVDAEGVRIPDATIQVGRRLPPQVLRHAAPGSTSTAPPIVLQTDAQGRFQRAGLSVLQGKAEIYVRAPGYSMACAFATFTPDQPARDLRIQLDRGREIAGLVTDARGQPVAGARVEAVVASEANHRVTTAPRWMTPVAWSGADGRYVLRAIPDFVELLIATGPDGARDTTKATTLGHAWHPALRPLGALRGRLRSSDGTTLGELLLRAKAASGAAVAETRSAKDGTFEFTACEDVPHTVQVLRADSAWSAPVHACPHLCPGPTVHLIDLPPASLATSRVHGRARYPDGRAAHVRGRLLGPYRGSAYATGDAATGAFDFGPLPALPYPLTLRVETRDRHQAILGPIVLKDQELDLGDVLLEQCGSLSLRVRGAGRRGKVQIFNRAGALAFSTVLTEGQATVRSIAPGDWSLTIADGDLPLMPTPFRIRSGETTLLEPTALASTPTTFDVHAPEAGVRALLLTWHDRASGRVGHSHRRCDGDRPAVGFQQRLTPGHYSLEARTPDGLSGKTDFEVTTSRSRVRLDLR
ncbi:MAG: sigma-70 family RNA polymerase sigma factor [Planctomycetota bacterium]